MTTRKSQSGQKKLTSAGTHVPEPRNGTKEEEVNACWMLSCSLVQEQARMSSKGRRISSRISFPSCRKIFPLQATTAKTTEKKADLETRIEKLFLDDLAIVHLTTRDRELSAELGALRQRQIEMDTKHVDERPSFVRGPQLGARHIPGM